MYANIRQGIGVWFLGLGECLESAIFSAEGLTFVGHGLELLHHLYNNYVKRENGTYELTIAS